MDREEIEGRIIICDERARGYLEVGKCWLADKYYTEKYKWEKLLSELDLLNDRKIYELLEYRKGYFSLTEKCEKQQQVINKAIKVIEECKMLFPHEFDWEEQTDNLLQILEDKEVE